MESRTVPFFCFVGYCAWFLFILHVSIGQLQAGEVTYTWKFEKYAVGTHATGGAKDTSIGVMMSDIIRLPDGTYRMYYGALPSPPLPSGATTAIKSATSTDGINWTVEDGYRLIGDGDGDGGPDGIPANEGVISGPRVVQLSDGTFRMYYQASTMEVMPPDFRIKSATSADGITWTREGTVIDINYPNGGPNQFSLAGHCYVIRFADDDYVILISGNYEKDVMKPSDIVMGTSSDGLTFTNFTILYEQGHDPYVLRLADGSGYRLFYGLLLERQRTAFSTDGKNWPPASKTTETILLDATGDEVTEASPEAPGDRSAIERPEGILLFVNWGSPSVDIALMKEQPAPLPDLTGEWSRFIGKDRIIVGRFTVRNIGMGDAGSFKMAYHLSDDPIFDAGDSLIRTQTILSLSAGESKTLRFVYKSRVPLQGKFIIAVVDSADQVLESSEENNRVSSPQIQ